MRRLDAIVIGVGGIGSAALYELARRGVSVLGIEQFDLAHQRGSSHGESRLIRRAYFEHPGYVPLVDESFRQWAKLEQAAGRQLFIRTGLLLAGPPKGAIVAGTSLAARMHNLDIEPVSIDESRRRFPMIRPVPEMEVLFEPDAGFLRVEECIRTHVRLAEEHSAHVAWNTPVRRISPTGGGFTVETTNGAYASEKLVVCGGAWAALLLEDLRLPLTPRRKPVFWYRVHDDRFHFQKGFPVFGFEVPAGFIYGFPSQDGGTIKIANHSGGDPCDPDQLDRELHDADMLEVTAFVGVHLSGVEQSVERHAVCMYTMTPDEHFIIDRHPRLPNLAFVAGLSGHGFKFAPVLGAALADLTCGVELAPAFHFLSLRRPALNGRHSPTRGQ